jgi:hypothetical protein
LSPCVVTETIGAFLGLFPSDGQLHGHHTSSAPIEGDRRRAAVEWVLTGAVSARCSTVHHDGESPRRLATSRNGATAACPWMSSTVKAATVARLRR